MTVVDAEPSGLECGGVCTTRTGEDSPVRVGLQGKRLVSRTKMAMCRDVSRISADRPLLPSLCRASPDQPVRSPSPWMPVPSSRRR